MQCICPQCNETLTFAETAPKFCSNCGQPLGSSKGSTVEYAPDVVTLAPSVDPEAATLAPAPGTPATASAGPEVLGGYKLLRTLGGGGMGTVYEAEDPHSGRHVALKVVLPQYAGSKETLERFRQEGELASSLSHPRCVFVLGADEDAGRPYIVMELMSGATLQDLVRDQGPLPAEEAIRKILDVIDGLEEAHRLGLVHRDVKPSNCFVEADGHVKIGDFGLARSLVRDTHLTRTGTFLGTPLYSSPEQVKAEKVDAQSDVYSVAATLYFLLTGQAPFQSGDAMATLARIVSDDPPSLRTLKPGLPKALDKAVLRGLERDRKRRWKDLGAFRKALARFLPVQPSIGDIGVRFGAWMIDYAVMQIGLNSVIIAGIELAAAIYGLTGNQQALAGATLGPLSHVLYFGLMEGLLGWSVGKGALRLRVCRLNDARPPGLLLGFVRILALTALISGGYFVAFLPRWLGWFSEHNDDLMVIGGILIMLGMIAVFAPMRRRNAYRGLHEWLSGTRTVRLAWPEPARRPSLRSRVKETLEGSPVEGLPGRVGPYHVRGLVHRFEKDDVLLAEEPSLKRRVWIWLRPAERPPLTESQRQLSRATRQRWLSCGRHGERQWDAFLAPHGEPLRSLIQREGPQPWSETRLLLEHLAEELSLAGKEGTLPAALGMNQLRMQADGQIQLVETPLSPPAVSNASSPQQGLGLLRQVVALALEGQPRHADAMERPIAAPVPIHAQRMVGLLLGHAQKPSVLSWIPRRRANRAAPYEDVEQLQAELVATQHRPVDVRRWPRGKHLVLQMLLIFTAGAIGLLITPLLIPLGIVLAYAGSELSFRLAGISVVDRHGRGASFWRRLARTLMAWTFVLPLAGLAFMALAVFEDPQVDNRLGIGLLAVVAAALASYLGVILWYPSRAPHDRVVGTFLVPE